MSESPKIIRTISESLVLRFDAKTRLKHRPGGMRDGLAVEDEEVEDTGVVFLVDVPIVLLLLYSTGGSQSLEVDPDIPLFTTTHFWRTTGSNAAS